MCNPGPGNQHPSTSLLSAIVKLINTQGSTKFLKGQLKLPDSNFLICKSKSSIYSGGDIVPVFLFSKTGTLLPIRYIFMRPIPKNRQIYIYFFLLTANLGLVLLILFVQFSQSDLPPLRPLCSEAPGLDSNPGRADLVAGTLSTRPCTSPHGYVCLRFLDR